jgi:hypothetical protein
MIRSKTLAQLRWPTDLNMFGLTVAALYSPTTGDDALLKGWHIPLKTAALVRCDSLPNGSDVSILAYSVNFFSPNTSGY